MRLGLIAIVGALASAAAPAPALAGLAGCDAFIASLRIAASDLQVDFSHAIVVSRAKSDADVFDISTKADVDATLTCRGDAMVRLEARIGEPAGARTTTNFEHFQIAALHAALGWEAAKSRGVLKGMSVDAREFLAASRQRGDVYVAGKTEEHQPGGVSLGLMYTDSDRIFVVVGGGQ